MEEGREMGLEEFLRDVCASLGDDVRTDEEEISRYSRDWWPLAMLLERLGSWNLRPKAVISVESAEEVSYVLRKANEHRVRVVVHGGGSSVTGASAPPDDCVVLSLGKMKRVVDFSEEDLTVTVEAGALLCDLEEWLNVRGYTLRHVPQSFHLATVGGCIASMSSGQYSTGYGNVEDLVLNLEVVTPTGEILKTRNVLTPRSSMGPNLVHLFVGSEGAFGVITKATLRVLPLPKYSVRAAFGTRSFSAGLRIVRELIVNGMRPSVARLSDESESVVRFGSNEPVLLLSYEGYEQELVTTTWEKARNRVEELGGSYMGEGPYDSWLKSRFNYLNEMKLLDSMGLWFETVDVAATWSKIPRLHESMRSRMKELTGVAGVLAHASHFYVNGGALYYTIVYERDPALYWKIVKTAFDVALEFGGTISHHHGVGQLRRKWVERDPGPASILLSKIKDAVDPNNVLYSNIC
ncbi:MAG: FAD-binding oxidoreductase [Candidatus Caldarchaeales archaeon]